VQVIHFTRAAADPYRSPGLPPGFFVPLADGGGDTHVACLHLDPGAAIDAPVTHGCALLVVHGEIYLTLKSTGANIRLQSGMGAVLERGEGYSLLAAQIAIAVIVEAQTLKAHERGISTPQRIAGATWPDAITAP
jgi:hypothetical protein